MTILHIVSYLDDTRAFENVGRVCGFFLKFCIRMSRNVNSCISVKIFVNIACYVNSHKNSEYCIPFLVKTGPSSCKSDRFMKQITQILI